MGNFVNLLNTRGKNLTYGKTVQCLIYSFLSHQVLNSGIFCLSCVVAYDKFWIPSNLKYLLVLSFIGPLLVPPGLNGILSGLFFSHCYSFHNSILKPRTKMELTTWMVLLIPASELVLFWNSKWLMVVNIGFLLAEISNIF